MVFPYCCRTPLPWKHPDSGIEQKPSKMRTMKVAALLIGLLGLSVVQAGGAENATPNDTARFLAGLPPAPSSPLAALAAHPGWQRHADHMNSMFGRVEE